MAAWKNLVISAYYFSWRVCVKQEPWREINCDLCLKPFLSATEGRK